MTKSIIHPSVERPEFFVVFCQKIKTAKFNILHRVRLRVIYTRVRLRVIYTVNLIIILASFICSNDSLMLHSSKILKISASDVLPILTVRAEKQTNVPGSFSLD